MFTPEGKSKGNPYTSGVSEDPFYTAAFLSDIVKSVKVFNHKNSRKQCVCTYTIIQKSEDNLPWLRCRSTSKCFCNS